MDQLDKLKKKLMKLHETYANDIGASYKEATQTQMEIEMLEQKISQIENLENSNIPNKEYILKGENTLKVTLTAGEIDTKSYIISFNSPLGKNLSKSKIGDKVRMGKNEYIIETIN